MAQPLTKTEPDGALYRRPAAVEAQIDAAVQLSLPDLRRRLLVTDRDDAAHLCSECLVHLLRRGRRAGDQALMSAVLPVLLGRCGANLLVTVPDGRMPGATSLRQDILDELTELFVVDGSGRIPTSSTSTNAASTRRSALSGSTAFAGPPAATRTLSMSPHFQPPRLRASPTPMRIRSHASRMPSRFFRPRSGMLSGSRF